MNIRAVQTSDADHQVPAISNQPENNVYLFSAKTSSIQIIFKFKTFTSCVCVCVYARQGKKFYVILV
jgi:hypothetical protein